jgi:hypothetical protein
VIGRALVPVLAAVLQALAGCGEKVQTMDASARRTDSQPWDVSSAANPGFAAAGWKGGDQAAWEAQIRQRNQAQNDYVR